MATKKPASQTSKRSKKPRSSVVVPGQKKKMGQPTKLTATTKQSICDALRMGAYVETAVAHAGITKETHYKWMKRAATEIARRERHEIALADEALVDAQRQRPLQKRVVAKRSARDAEHKATCDSEQLYVDYADSIEKAMAEGELGALGTIARVARGGVVVSRTTTKDPSGGTQTTEKLSRPEWTAAAWMLERRHPRKYGKLLRQEVTGAEGGPVAMTWADAVKEAFEGDDSDPDSDFDGA